MTRPGLKKRTKKGLTRKCHAHVGVRVLIIDAQVIHIGTRGLPARIFEGDLPGGDKAGREVRTRVAQFVRNETFRSPGSSAATAGNGGRLMMDLGEFNEKERERIKSTLS